MTPEQHTERVAIDTAEEVLRVIYGDDLQGCAVSLDTIAAVIRKGVEEHARGTTAVADLHAKAFEAVELLATPPADGHSLSADDLRSLLGERLDKIRELSAKVLAATATAPDTDNEQNGTRDVQS